MHTPSHTEHSLASRRAAMDKAQHRLEQVQLHRVRSVDLFGELSVAQRIIELESAVLRAQSDVCFDSSQLVETAAEDDLADFVLQMRLSHKKVLGVWQEGALQRLRQDIRGGPLHLKSDLVNGGALVAVIDAMKEFPERPRLQKDAAALLLNFALMEDTCAILDTEGRAIQLDTDVVASSIHMHLVGLDTGILVLIQGLGGLDLLVRAMERNSYQFVLSYDNEIKSYSLQLAVSQIPPVMNRIQALLRDGNDPVLLRKKLRFLRSCFSTLLDDAELAPTNLMTYVS
jgi:hypothetical protein